MIGERTNLGGWILGFGFWGLDEKRLMHIPQHICTARASGRFNTDRTVCHNWEINFV